MLEAMVRWCVLPEVRTAMRKGFRDMDTIAVLVCHALSAAIAPVRALEASACAGLPQTPLPFPLDSNDMYVLLNCSHHIDTRIYIRYSRLRDFLNCEGDSWARGAISRLRSCSLHIKLTFVT
jgi:hypothetical protein